MMPWVQGWGFKCLFENFEFLKVLIILVSPKRKKKEFKDPLSILLTREGPILQDATKQLKC